MNDLPTIPTNFKMMKTHDKKAYMRDYKRKQYADPEIGKQMKKENMIRYYKKRGYEIDDEFIEKYGMSIPIVLKLKKAIKDIMNSEMMDEEQKQDLLTNIKSLI
tara:strand:- start:629 stop:940 length:312 start_codon:yes stop_codon:yes gene_type:complete